MSNLTKVIARDSPLPLWIAIGLAVAIYGWHYLTYPAVPDFGTSPLDWWVWFDQSVYSLTVQALLGEIAPSDSVPPLYPALGIPFWALMGKHAFLLPNLALFVAYVTIYMKLISRYIGPWLALLSIILGMYQYSILTLQWTIPWTSTAAAVLGIGAIALADAFLRLRSTVGVPPATRIWIAGGVGLLVGLLGATRLGDFLAFFPLLAILGVLSFVDFQRGGAEERKSIAISVLLAACAVVMPPLLFLLMNDIFYGAPFGGYFSIVRGGGGAAFGNFLDSFYSHVINADAFYGAPASDWISEIPVLAATVLILPVAVFWGPAILRMIALVGLTQIFVVYSYADAVPTGQFLYYNIHYFKWLWALLPALAIYPVVAFVSGSGKRRWSAGAVLSCWTLLILAALSIQPQPQLIQPRSVSRTASDTILVDFGEPAVFDYISIPGVAETFGSFSLRDNRVRLDDGVELVPMAEFRLVPAENGMRVLMIDPTRASKIEIQFDALAEVPDDVLHLISASRVEMTVGWPRANRSERSEVGMPYIEVGRTYSSVEGGEAHVFFRDGWSQAAEFGRLTDGDVASIAFRLPEDRRGPLLVYFEAFGLYDPRGPAENYIDILANGAMIGTMFLTPDGPRQFSFPLPEQHATPTDAIWIELRPRETFRWEEVSVAPDRSELSAGITGFGLYPR